MSQTAAQWLAQLWLASLPPDPVRSVVEWCRANVRLIGSARSETYDPDISPWTREPLECAADGTRRMTFVGPVQSGKSAVGEMAICYWVATQNGGDIQYNWQNDEQADARWQKRVERILLACPPVVSRMSADRFKWKKGLVIFPHCNLTMQGVYTDRNVASESIRFQVNEEIHDAEGWLPGRLQQAHNRTTAFWNSVIFNISNAGHKGDQLHQAFAAGTAQRWEVRCPSCGQYHAMRSRWDDKQPALGGLRYDADAARLENGEVNYRQLLPTIRYQMPCGFQVRDDLTQRRRLSLSGRYSTPTNTGAELKERSYTLEAVAVDYISWIDLIKEKHRALRSLKYGDSKPWWDYLRERECQFVDPEDRPIVQRIVLSESRKDRAGLPSRVGRFGALDYQQGRAADGEMPHWWALIQDVETLPDGRIHILTVHEGKHLTDEDAAGVMLRHNIPPSCVAVDSGYNAPHVYQFCLKHGFSAIKGSPDALFSHPLENARRIFSPEKPLHAMLNIPPTRDSEMDEPQFWFYSQPGLMDRLAWLRSSAMVDYEVPSDVSADFISHMDSWSLESRKNARTGEVVPQWVQHKTRDDLFFCACYVAMFLEMAGLIGASAGEKEAKNEPT